MNQRATCQGCPHVQPPPWNGIVVCTISGRPMNEHNATRECPMGLLCKTVCTNCGGCHALDRCPLPPGTTPQYEAALATSGGCCDPPPNSSPNRDAEQG